MILAVLALLLARPAVPAVTVYVGPAVRDGFVDTDKGVHDSVKDVRAALSKYKDLRVVGSEADAELRLYVVRRGLGGPTAGVTVQAAPTVGLYMPVHARFVETTLRVGAYERTIVGDDPDSENWKKCAKRIAEDVRVWIAANRQRLTTKP